MNHNPRTSSRSRSTTKRRPVTSARAASTASCALPLSFSARWPRINPSCEHRSPSAAVACTLVALPETAATHCLPPPRGRAAEALAWTKAVMTKLGLTINEAKTSLRNARQERFDFLGYSFGAHLFEANGNWYLGASPSKKSVQRLKTSSEGQLLRQPHAPAWPCDALQVRATARNTERGRALCTGDLRALSSGAKGERA